MELAQVVAPSNSPEWMSRLTEHLGGFARREMTFAPQGDNRPTVSWTDDGKCLIYVDIDDPTTVAEALGLGALSLTLEQSAQRIVAAALLDMGYTLSNSAILYDQVAIVSEPVEQEQDNQDGGRT